MALGLGLVAVLPHDLLEGYVESQDLGHDIDAAHEDLVEMTVPHQVRGLQHGVLEAGPHPAERDSGETVERDQVYLCTKLW